jgi:hypothetical protein
MLKQFWKQLPQNSRSCKFIDEKTDAALVGLVTGFTQDRIHLNLVPAFRNYGHTLLTV